MGAPGSLRPLACPDLIKAISPLSAGGGVLGNLSQPLTLFRQTDHVSELCRTLQVIKDPRTTIIRDNLSELKHGICVNLTYSLHTSEKICSYYNVMYFSLCL